jgi:hypothetical protein
LPSGLAVTSLRLRPLSDSDEGDGEDDAAPPRKVFETQRESPSRRPEIRRKYDINDW